MSWNAPPRTRRVVGTLECRGFEITAFGEIANCRTYGEIYLRHWQDQAQQCLS